MQAFDVSAVLAGVPGVVTIDEVPAFPADLTSGRRGDPVPRLEVGTNALVLSYRHEVMVSLRGTVSGLTSPHPLGGYAPSALRR